MQIQADFLESDSLQLILAELGKTHKAHLVGGCVRDAIIGLPVSDIDIATSATPDEVADILSFYAYDLRPTGVEHGTWTVVDRDTNEVFEVTTYRKDVSTDGRRATVEFSTRMKEDAQRRDFTMNALYMDGQGNVYDPLQQGIEDLMARKVRFVGEAVSRCDEDFLRILRLFRFHAKYGKGPIDHHAFWAAKHRAAGLRNVSGERKWTELKKILSCHDPMDALYEMERSGVLDVLLPRVGFASLVADVIHVERQASMAPGWERRLVALMGYDEDAVQMPFPTSRAEQKYLTTLAQNHSRSGIPAHAAYRLKDERTARDCYVLYVAFGGGNWFDPQDSLDRGMAAECPITAKDLMECGVKPGPELGRGLELARQAFLVTDLLGSKELVMDKVQRGLFV